MNKPRKIPVQFAEALNWRGGQHLFQRKYDGTFDILEIGGASRPTVLIVERMRPKSGGKFTAADRALFAQRPEFYAVHDVEMIQGDDVSREPTRVRWLELVRLTPELNRHDARIVLADSGNGGEFVAAVDGAGGEGVVAKAWDSPLDGYIFAAKRLETFFCAVTGFNGGVQSVSIEDGATGHPRGSVALLGGKVERVRLGSILKIEGLGLSAEGKIREPRLCTDTADSWLVKF